MIGSSDNAKVNLCQTWNKDIKKITITSIKKNSLLSVLNYKILIIFLFKTLKENKIIIQVQRPKFSLLKNT